MPEIPQPIMPPMGKGPDVEATYIDSIHFVCFKSEQDFLMTIFRETTPENPDGAGSPWKARWRFRYYVDHKAHDSEDRKSAYACKADGSQESLDRLRHMSTLLANQMRKDTEEVFHEVVELQCRNDHPKMMFEIGSRDWAHLKMVSL